LAGWAGVRATDAIFAPLAGTAHVNTTLVDRIITVIIVGVTHLRTVVQTGPRVGDNLIDHVQKTIDIVKSIQA
jgi:hypothetical protein